MKGGIIGLNLFYEDIMKEKETLNIKNKRKKKKEVNCNQVQ